MFPSKDQPVRAIVQFGLIVETLPVTVAVCDIADDAALRLARILLIGLLGLAACDGEKHKECWFLINI